MLTTDLSLRVDPIYEPISRYFFGHPDELADAFARAWFKLTHRDMGPVVRYLGPEVPSETLIWQDPVPAAGHKLIDATDAAMLKGQILGSGLTVAQRFRPRGDRPRRSAAATSAAVPTGRASAWSRKGDGRSTVRKSSRPYLVPWRGFSSPSTRRTIQGRRARRSLCRRPDRAGRKCSGRKGGRGCRRRLSRSPSRRGALTRPRRKTDVESVCGAGAPCRWVSQLCRQPRTVMPPGVCLLSTGRT